MIKNYLAGLLLGIMILLSSCSSVALKESPIDNPKDHYTTGLAKLDKDDIAGAEADFLRAVTLDKKSPVGYAGYAFLQIKKKDYKLALKYTKKSLKRKPDFADALTAKGYAICMMKKDKNWMTQSLDLFKKASEIDSTNQRIIYMAAECCLGIREFQKALDYYTKASTLDGPFKDKIRSRLDIVKRIIAINPDDKRTSRISIDDKIDRTDLCALLVYEFKIKEKIKKVRPDYFDRIYAKDFITNEYQHRIPPDVSGSKEKWAIYEIIPLYLDDLKVLPNGYFSPDRLITRAQLASVMQNIIVIMKDDYSYSTKYVGQKSRFFDVNPNYYAFNAIMLSTDENLITFNKKNINFNPDDPVSGIEAIESLIKLFDFLGIK